MDKYIEEYCQQNNDVNKRELKKYIKTTSGKRSVIRGIFDNYRKIEGREFDINRYYESKNHCLLLFEANGQLSDFFNENLQDLHGYTGNTLDIYFTMQDLKKNVSAYNKIKKLSYFKIEKRDIPCLLVWNNNNEEKNISLYGLNHKEIYEIIKKFVDCLEKYDFDKSIFIIREKVEEINKIKEEIEKMGKYNLNNCQIGIVGDGTVVNNMILNNSQKIELDLLSDEVIQIKEKIINKENKGIEEYELLSNIDKIQEHIDKKDISNTRNSIIKLASNLFYSMATGVGSGIIANILSKSLGI
ncbi:hypothetical protein [Clostridium gasigenes]|uniref:Uncharacterized protein n=1 Tax=Clostridium gasigenes TaxID=94869 RepID=A0A7X0SC62_9CLOT|nr:hypothetical protein [Clostridium gasigenes]MBB6714790.1 hypothetical protein [Clostridium gasigenes]